MQNKNRIADKERETAIKIGETIKKMKLLTFEKGFTNKLIVYREMSELGVLDWTDEPKFLCSPGNEYISLNEMHQIQIAYRNHKYEESGTTIREK